MTGEQPLVNRVANSGLITLDLERFYPNAETAVFDLKDYLFQGLILREKDFREVVKNHDWSQYAGKTLLVHCSADAIIPMWAYMLVSTAATPFAADIFQGSPDEWLRAAYRENIAGLDIEPYKNQRLVIKGCGDKPVPPAAYLAISRRLQPVAKSIMFGEPCSTVPVYKRKD